MLVVETIARIRRDHLVRGVPIKAIERDLKVSRNTVRKVNRSDATAFSYHRRSQPSAPAPIPTPVSLRLRHEPMADCTRYDRLRGAGHGAP